jgi:hypothetical protein
MKKLFAPVLLLGVACAVFFAQAADTAVKPLRVLIVAGGCCHDYETQQALLKEGMKSASQRRGGCGLQP